MMNILSIDWDYFFNATAEQRYYWFPDGGNEAISNALGSYIWATRYSQNPIETIKTDAEAIKKAQRIAVTGMKQGGGILMVTDSHKFIHDAITDLTMIYNLDEPFRIWNIDYHHDYYGLRFDEVDCGNWVNNLFDERSMFRPMSKLSTDNSEYHWIRREDSAQSDELSKKHWYYEDTLDELEEKVKEDEIQFDLVFLCRSGCWSPPHLDEEFESFYKSLSLFASITKLSNTVEGSRYSDEFKGMATQIKDAMDQVKKGMMVS